MKSFPSLVSCFLFLGSALCSQAISVAVSPESSQGEGVAGFIFEVLEVNLAGTEEIELVDRAKLRELLAEQNLGASGMTGENAAALGKLVGAQYYVFGKTINSGEQTALNCRVVQVETGVFQPVLTVVPTDENPLTAGEELAGKVREAITKLEGRAEPMDESATTDLTLTVPESSVLPTIAMRIPEASLTPNAATADPAAEKALEKFFEANDCDLIQLSRPSQSVSAVAEILAGEGSPAQHLEGDEHEALLQEAKAKNVDVLILGVAASENAARIGDFNTARSRVELSAIRVSDSKILTTTSGYGVGSDLSPFVAEKKAIESATEKLRKAFAEDLVKAFGE
jgi:hypothetical protein